MRTGKDQMLPAERVKLGKRLKAALVPMDGFKEDPNRMYTWEIDTEVGVLAVHFDGEYGTIFTRFAEPERAKAVVGCNPYTGKWNYHVGRVTAEVALSYFLSELSRVAGSRGKVAL